MSRIKTEQLHDELQKKKEKYGFRITTYVDGLKVTTFTHGTTASSFLDDCIKREWNESKMAAHVLKTYYEIMNTFPDLKEQEPNQIKKYIIDKIKFE